MKSALLMVQFSLLLLLPKFALAGATLSFGSIPVGVPPGSIVTIGVEITEVVDLYAFQFDMSYDPAILELTSTSEGSFLPPVAPTSFISGSIDNLTGVTSFNAGTLLGPEPGASGAGVLAGFAFTVLSPGSSPLTLSNITLLDSQGAELPATAIPGEIEVPEPSTTWLVLVGAFALAFRTSHREATS